MQSKAVAMRRLAMIAGILATPCGVALGQDQSAQSLKYTSALQQFFVSGGPIVWFVLLPLSVAMAAMAIWCALTIRRGNLVPEPVRQQVKELIEQRQYREALEFTALEPSMLSSVIHAALSAASGGYAAMQRALAEAVEERAANLLRRAEYMNIIGNISPMIGLFGTVYGMIRAFHELVLARGTPEPARLAEGISVALVTTFWGLLIAIPALSVFAIFRNRIDGLAAECALTADELLSVLQPATRPAAQQPVAQQPAGQTKPAAPAAGGSQGPQKAENPKGQDAARPPVAERIDESDRQA